MRANGTGTGFTVGDGQTSRSSRRRARQVAFILAQAALLAVGCGNSPAQSSPSPWTPGDDAPLDGALEDGSADGQAGEGEQGPPGGTDVPDGPSGDGNVPPPDDDTPTGDGTDTPPPGSDGSSGDGATGESACLFESAVDFESDGPFRFQKERSGPVNMWIPELPAGCKVPMVHLANGTGASCLTYNASLERLASHGFIALCYESANTGAGTQAMEAWEAALASHADIAALKFGSTGHSQGGQSAFCALRLAEEKWGADGTFAGLAMQPASGFGVACEGGFWETRYALITSPFFMFSGQGSDGLVSQRWVQDAFEALDDSVEAYHWAKAGGRHIPVPNGEEQQISIPWFRWKLLGDNEACKAFKAIRATDTSWEEAAVQNEEPCL